MTESAPKTPPDRLHQAVRDQYAAVAADPTQPFHFSTGRELARMLGYDDALLAGIPAGAIESAPGGGGALRGTRLQPAGVQALSVAWYRWVRPGTWPSR